MRILTLQPELLYGDDAGSEGELSDGFGCVKTAAMNMNIIYSLEISSCSLADTTPIVKHRHDTRRWTPVGLGHKLELAAPGGSL